MATRKKTKAFLPAPVLTPSVEEPKTAKSLIADAVEKMVGSSVSFSRPISAVGAVAGSREDSFSDGQDFERVSYTFTFRHPSKVTSTHRAVFLKKDFEKALRDELDYLRDAGLKREVMDIVTSRSLDGLVLSNVKKILAEIAEWISPPSYFDLSGDAKEILNVAVGEKSSTSYTAYERRKRETIEVAEYPTVYVRYRFTLEKFGPFGEPRVARDGNIVVDYKMLWDVESKRWSFDSEDLGSY